MHNREKYPEIFAAKEKAEAELVPLMHARKVHTDAMAELQIEIDKLQAQKVELNDKAMADAPRIAELRDQIARMAKAMQARVASES